MEMDVRNRSRFACQARFVEVIDVVVFAIEQVDDVKLQFERLAEGIGCPRIYERRRLRAYAVILDERARSKIAAPQSACPATAAFQGNPSRSDGVGRAGNKIYRRVRIAKPCVR